jgi:DNA mismatch endonuclease (patch repair protein)
MSRSENMARIHSKNTAPELVVRRAAHACGFRFRLHRRDLPGVPDLVFPRYRSVVMVHGCFWHQHSDPACRAGRLPATNLAYWGPKLTKNQVRDAENIARLKALGWRVLVVWECQVSNVDVLKQRITAFLSGRRYRD